MERVHIRHLKGQQPPPHQGPRCIRGVSTERHYKHLLLLFVQDNMRVDEPEQSCVLTMLSVPGEKHFWSIARNIVFLSLSLVRVWRLLARRLAGSSWFKQESALADRGWYAGLVCTWQELRFLVDFSMRTVSSRCSEQWDSRNQCFGIIACDSSACQCTLSTHRVILFIYFNSSLMTHYSFTEGWGHLKSISCSPHT